MVDREFIYNRIFRIFFRTPIFRFFDDFIYVFLKNYVWKGLVGGMRFKVTEYGLVSSRGDPFRAQFHDLGSQIYVRGPQGLFCKGIKPLGFPTPAPAGAFFSPKKCKKKKSRGFPTPAPAGAFFSPKKCKNQKCL